MCTERDFKELAHVIMEAGKSKIFRGGLIVWETQGEPTFQLRGYQAVKISVADEV